MIQGYVNGRYEAVVTITVQGPSGQTRQVDAVIDTGFNRYILLPTSLVSELELPLVFRSRVILANGNEDRVNVHRSSVLWDGQLREVDAYAAAGAPLIGMRMLDGYNLNMDVEPGGRVAIRAKEE